MATPVLGIVVPCYNEQEMLETTIRQLSAVISGLVDKNKVADSSCMILVDDGSRDATWDIISKHAAETSVVCGVKLAGNVGHQNALIAGLTAAVEFCDVTISIDADLQDDINVIEQMVDKYLSGTDIVYGVRDSRATDTFFKKNSALMFYKLMNALGTKTIYNHADYRLMSHRAAEKLLEFPERNLFIRGIVPLIGFTTDTVTYDRKARMAGESKYPLKKMLSFAVNGITSFSIRPIRLIFSVGIIMLLATIAVSLYTLLAYTAGHTIKGWTSLMLSLWFIGSLILISLGIIGEYIGKIYVEVKKRPRFFIEKSIINRTEKFRNNYGIRICQSCLRRSHSEGGGLQAQCRADGRNDCRSRKSECGNHHIPRVEHHRIYMRRLVRTKRPARRGREIA